jgi:putative PIN family toxin of toxin-antitoxin system
MKPVVVFDCMVFLQAVTNARGPAFACFQLLEEGKFTLAVSAAVLSEVRDVLTRPALRRKFPRLSEERVGEFLASVEQKAVLLSEVPNSFRYARDPDDEPYLNLAIAAGAQYLVTRDNDLLDLMRADVPEGSDFRKRFPNLVILDPVEFLRILPGLGEGETASDQSG